MIGAHKSPKYKEDLNRHALYLADHNPDAALKFVDAAEETLDLLATQPNMGAKRLFADGALALRMFPVSEFKRFLIFYRPFDEGVYAIRLLHSARDIEAEFE